MSSHKEFLDIVDEQNLVVGQDTREKIHKKHPTHRGVHVFVSNSKDELLLQKRLANKDYYPSFFDASVGVQVLAEESYRQAAMRETQEELGFTPQKLEKICDYKSYSDRQRENRRLFVCLLNGLFKIDEDELDSVRFYPLKHIQEQIEKEKMKFTEGFKISFRNYLDHLEANRS